MTAIAPIDMSELGNQVRHWVHYDKLLVDLNKQAAETRNKRQLHETVIINTLKAANHEKAVLQIVGGRILIAEERQSKPLTFVSLEHMLKEYFKQKTSPGKDETQDIIKFIKGNRTLETITKLKRQNTDPARKV